MKYIVLVLSLVSVLRAEEDPLGPKMEKLKLTDTLPTGNCETKVQDDDVVRFDSYGYTMDGKKFDSGTFEAKIGQDEIPKGVNEGLKGLCVGDERSMRIQPEWAYGEEGIPNKVAPNATVIYDVKVLNINRTAGVESTGLRMNEMLRITDTNTVADCGMKVQGRDKIYWHYIGKLTDETIFDQGHFNAVIDNREVILGVNEAMKGLCVGGMRTMLMHHSYGYGGKGTGNIPGYANLIFDVHLLSLDRPGFGWETLDSKLRKANVAAEKPIKITDRVVTGKCAHQGREGDKATWFYHAYLLDGKIFDQGQAEGKVGSKEVVPVGLGQGLKGLCVGDERSITLHPNVAFGVKGLSGKVPINATVIYDIKVLDVARVLKSDDAMVHIGVDKKTGLKPNQKLKIEIVHTIEDKDCKIKSQEGDTISWNYRGAFLDGTEFHKGTFRATLGKQQIILGVDRGMREMCIGEKRQLTVHSDWGYGNEGRAGSIPPRATLVFDNELTDIERPEPETTVEEVKTEL